MPLNISELILAPPNPHDLENAEDISSDESDYEPPFLQPVSKEELLIARAQKRIQKKAEKHAKAEVFKRMGDELYGKDKFDEAYIPYLEATQIWPSNVDYYVRLAMTYAKLGWYEEAAHASTRALMLEPKSIQARYLRGLARLEQRLLTAAKKDLETVTIHDPTHRRAGDALKSVIKALSAGNKTSTTDASDADGATIAAPTEPASASELDFSYPQYDDDALEVDTLSNTSDSNHRGNGVPCRFYNRDGCAKASLCPYSHAPDEKSVRDDLGRNVCIYFLLDSCKFGNGKCVYSHARQYLPKHGWWTSPEETGKVKAILELGEKAFKERRSHAAHLQLLERRSRPSKKTPRTPKTGTAGADAAHADVTAEGDEGKAEAGGESRAMGTSPTRKTWSRMKKSAQSPKVGDEHTVATGPVSLEAPASTVPENGEV